MHQKARRVCGLAAAVLAGLLVSTLASAAETAPTEYEIKAAFIYNFAKYVEWPENTGTDSGEAFVIGVLGEDPFGALLDQLARSKTVGNKRIVIHRFDTIDDYTPCCILFVAASEQDRLPAILEKLADSPVLVIGDTPGFARRGVAVNFFIEESKVRFEINPAAAARAGLKISSKLLRLAKIIMEETPDGADTGERE
jgi:hypothetical protein